ncbi:fused MFS/spermidine synthase [Pelomonas sp. CA6]|uniref:fused MFS/spermidine synthase n=1 Tax=Pelomonas sp. CA6 TaxID=2907999 RepID=UPI001F4C31C5|nr:fused MFS/spermidine synthase [Pelomonas sp. CA6]MCH7343970.1 fused MFS/spermidine synthase [Pelomonas sp. CA6]
MSQRAKTAKPGRIDCVPATLSEFDGVRFLHLDSIWVQGAMRIRKPQQLELEYIQRMMAWMLWRDTRTLGQGHAVQLGLGAAALTRFSHTRLKMKTTAVELNPSVISACRNWFHLPADDERLTVLHEDAGAWVADAANWGEVDVLNVDLYDHEAAGPVLDDEEFYQHCRAVLADGGLMTVNLFGRSASFARSASRIARAFGSDQVWHLAPTREGNTVVVAARGVTVPDREELERRAANIESRFDLPARKWLRLVRPLPISIINQIRD